MFIVVNDSIFAKTQCLTEWYSTTYNSCYSGKDPTTCQQHTPVTDVNVYRLRGTKELSLTQVWYTIDCHTKVLLYKGIFVKGIVHTKVLLDKVIVTKPINT